MNGGATTDTSATPALLQVQQLTTGLGTDGPEILRAVDLHLDAGEVLGVVGESGSGKSMLALSIMGLLPAGVRVHGGSIVLQGQDLLAPGAVPKPAAQ